MPRRRALPVLLSLLLSASALAAPALVAHAQENRRAAAFGIEVRQGRRPAAGVEVRLRLEGSSLAPTTAGPPPEVTDSEGRAEFWWLTPGIWQVDLVVDGEVAYFLTVRVEAGRRAQEMGAPARDADAPDMRWKLYRPSGAPPTPPPVGGQETVRETAVEEEPPPPPVREPIDETPPPPPPIEPAAAEPEPEMAEPEMVEPEMAEPEMAEPEMAEPELPQPAPEMEEPEMSEPAMSEPVPSPEPEPGPEAEEEPEMPPAPPPVAEVEAAEPEVPEPRAEEPEIADAPLPPGQVPVADEPEPEQSALARDRPQSLPQPPPHPTRPSPVEPQPGDEPPTAPKPEPLLPRRLEDVPFSDDAPAATEAAEPQPMPEPAIEPEPTPMPAPAPPPAAASAPAALDPPRFSVRTGAAGDCEECRQQETAVRVERTVPAGDGTCASGAGTAARNLAARLAARGEGLGAGMPLDGAEVVELTGGGASCQLFGVVLPPGVRYRGYTYAVADGGGGGGACFIGKQCPIAGAIWPNRPTIEELPNGARVVFALFQNASGVPLRASLTAYYVAGE